MSNLGLQMEPGSATPNGLRHRGRSWIAVLLSLGVLALIGLGVKVAIDGLPSFGTPPEDFVGEGTEPVEITVTQGQTVSEIGRTLKDEGVVASVDAWVAAAAQEPRAATIGPGRYDMRLEMSAESAVTRMVDPATRITDKLLLREGLRIWESVEAISKASGISRKKIEAALDKGGFGLPKYAKGNAEGFLFPATYELEKGETATDILTRLVERFDQAAAQVKLTRGAKAQGLSTYEALIVASLVQAEGHPDDFDKIARVIYNRLDPATQGGTYGLLQMDATLNYALRKSTLNLSTEELQKTDSPFNTYLNPGLPPTPINSPGEAAMEAALNPADGPWLYYVTVNPDTGETKFTDDYDEFLTFKKEFADWTAANP